MTETLYLVLGPNRRSHWRGRVRIESVSKSRPTLQRPSEQALLILHVNLPDNALQPRAVNVEIKPEHIAAPVITVAPQKAE